MISRKSRYTKGESPNGAPGCPLFAFSTASTARNRSALIDTCSSSLITSSLFFTRILRFPFHERDHLLGSDVAYAVSASCICQIEPNFEIAALPALVLTPLDSKDHPAGFSGLGFHVSKVTCVPYGAALDPMHSLPVIDRPDEIKAVLCQHAELSAGNDAFDLPVEPENLHRGWTLGSPIAIRHGGDAVEYFPIRDRTQKLHILGVSPDQRHGRAGKFAQFQA